MQVKGFRRPPLNALLLKCCGVAKFLQHSTVVVDAVTVAFVAVAAVASERTVVQTLARTATRLGGQLFEGGVGEGEGGGVELGLQLGVVGAGRGRGSLGMGGVFGGMEVKGGLGG